MSPQIFLALLNPQLGIAALLVGAFVTVSIYIYKYRCQMDPELAKIRVLEKIVNRSLPRWRRRGNAPVDDYLKSAITALTTISQSVPEPEDPGVEHQGAEHQGAEPANQENGPGALDDP